MGMFDLLRVNVQLPDRNSVTDEQFQTKSFDSMMESYVITLKGELYKESWQYEEIETSPDDHSPLTINKVPGSYRREYLTDFHGDVTFYGEWMPSGIWREYTAEFTAGKMTKLGYTDRPITEN